MPQASSSSDIPNFIFRSGMADVFEPEKDILHVIVTIDFELTIDIVKAHNEMTLKMLNEQVKGVLFDARNITITRIPNEVMRYSSDNEYAEFQTCFAMLINSKLMMQICSFYIRVFRPKVPTRVFTEETKALEWVRSMNAKSRI
ncbi:MAG: hypothetical protein ACRCYO_11115 [Bacteroidia bacterium]